MKVTPLLIICFVYGCSHPQARPCLPPIDLADGWSVAAPADAGLDQKALCATLESAFAGDFNFHGLIVERDQRLVAEAYRTGPDRPIDVLFGIGNPFAADVAFGPTTLHDTRSISKSVVSLLFGIVAPDETLNTPVYAYLSELKVLGANDRERITIEHLLTMSSGLDWDEGGLPNDETQLFARADLGRFVFDRPLRAEPGATWLYNSGSTAVLAEILRRRTGQSLTTLARERLFAPLGITDWTWAVDLRGRELSFTGLRLRPRDMAKLGRMVLDGGKSGDRQIVPAEWIARSLRPRITTNIKLSESATAPLTYGYQWWSGQTRYKNGTIPWYAAFGNGGQRIYLVPELDLQVIITAGEYGSQAISFEAQRVFEEIVRSVE